METKQTHAGGCDLGTELENRVLGTMLKATVIPESPFDPKNEALRFGRRARHLSHVGVGFVYPQMTQIRTDELRRRQSILAERQKVFHEFV